jgi:hypothetical protein
MLKLAPGEERRRDRQRRHVIGERIGVAKNTAAGGVAAFSG